jgi:glycosyltransferase involved in cell wall biosynthesis
LKGLIYLSNARVPSEKANAKQSMSQCEALGKLFDVEFWHPVRRTAFEVPDVYDFYGLTRTFRTRPIRCLDVEALRQVNSRAAFFLQALTFLMACAARLTVAPSGAVIYSRNQFDLLIAPALRVFRRDVSFFFEDHDGLLARFPKVKRALLRAVRGIVVTTPFHAKALTDAGVAAQKVLTCSNGVRIDHFGDSELPPFNGVFRVVYAGNLFEWKGVFVLAGAARRLPPKYQVEFLGGSPEAEQPFRTHLVEAGLVERVIVRGYVPPRELPAAFARANVLVLPNSAKRALSHTYTSPLKLFEYMAAGRPIVASDVPAVRNVLTHGHNAILVQPDDPSALAEGIQRVCEDRALAATIAAQARRDVEAYTWDNRAARIARFVAEQCDPQLS